MSHKNSLLLVDPEFDPNTAPDCNLLLKITADSFSYAIIDKTNNQLKAVYDQQECTNVVDKFSAKIKNDPYLTLGFKETKVAVYTENTISIPNDLFDPENLNQYAKFFTEDQQSDKLYARPSLAYGFTSIFTLHKFIDELLVAYLNSCKLFDHTTPVLALATHSDAKSLTLDFTASSFNAILTEGEKLIFSNYYAIENAEEFNYYLLFIVNQLDIDTAGTSVSLTGIIHENDSQYRCIEKYFKNITFRSSLNNELDQKILDDMPAHYYSSLLALDLCE